MKFKAIISTLLGISLANAKLVMVIRHGEKLNDKVTNLSPKGEARAKCLINIFGNNGIYATPQKIYAQNPTEKKQSTRPKDTVVPLAHSLGLQVDLSYTSGKVKKLAADILNSPEEIVLVSWSNDKIPEIAEQFNILNAPGNWDKDIFDDIWMITDGTPYTNQQTYDNVNNNSNFGTNNGNFGTNNNNNNFGNSNNNGYTTYNTNNDGNNDIFNTGYNNDNMNNNGNMNNNNNNNGYNYDSNINTGNNGNFGNYYSKRNTFTLDIVKQNIDECISKELSSSPSVGQNNGNASTEENSGSIELKTSLFMTIFSMLLYIFIYNF